LSLDVRLPAHLR